MITPPVISGVGPDGTIECPDEPQFSSPSATDACDDDPSLTFEDERTDGDCPQEYSVTRTWTATDACGNTSTATQTINVIDITPPVISGVGPDGTIECPDEPQFSSPSATDACDDDPSLTFEDERMMEIVHRNTVGNTVILGSGTTQTDVVIRVLQPRRST